MAGSMSTWLKGSNMAGMIHAVAASDKATTRAKFMVVTAARRFHHMVTTRTPSRGQAKKGDSLFPRMASRADGAPVYPLYAESPRQNSRGHEGRIARLSAMRSPKTKVNPATRRARSRHRVIAQSRNQSMGKSAI